MRYGRYMSIFLFNNLYSPIIFQHWIFDLTDIVLLLLDFSGYLGKLFLLENANVWTWLLVGIPEVYNHNKVEPSYSSIVWAKLNKSLSLSTFNMLNNLLTAYTSAGRIDSFEYILPLLEAYCEGLEKSYYLRT